MSKRIYEGWEGFEHGTWVNEINLRSFIRHNFTPYDGDESFLDPVDSHACGKALSEADAKHGGGESYK